MTAVALAAPGRTSHNDHLLACLRHAITADDPRQVQAITEPLLPLVDSGMIDTKTGVRVLMAEAWALYRHGQGCMEIIRRLDFYVKAIELLKRCADKTADRPTAEHAEVLVNLAYLYYLVGRYERGREIMAYMAGQLQARPTRLGVGLYMATHQQICRLLDTIKRL